MLAYLVALVFAVLSVCGSVEGTFTLDGWDGPVDTPNARRPSGTPQARLFGGKVVIVYQANGQLQYSTSTDGTTFGGVGLVDVVTPYDPALVEATDSITGQSRLILVSAYGPGSNTLGYAVWDGSAFPSTLTNTSLTNVGGEVDAIYNYATGKIVFVYISSKPADADQFWCWSATAVLSDGQLTQIVPYDNLYTGANGGTQCAAGTKSQIATFVNPSTSSITFVQPENYKLGSTGDMYFFTTVDPAQGWSESGLNGRIFPGNSTQPASGLAAVSFTIGEDCADLVAIFYIGSSGALGYTLITQPISNQQSSVFGAAHTVMRTNGATVTFTGPPTAVFAFGKIFLYYMDLNQNPTQVAAIYTTPKL